MKKTTKSLLITAAILFGLGLLITLSATLFTTIQGIDAFGMERKLSTIENKTVSLDEILSNSPNASFSKGQAETEFKKVDLRSFAGDLKIVPSDGETRLQLDHTNTANLSYEIVGETLIIKELDAVGISGIYIDDDGFSFKGMRQLFGPGNSANTGKTVTLFLAMDVKLESIQIRSKIGSVDVDGVFSDQLNIECFSGSIDVKNLRNPDGRIKIDGNLVQVNLVNNVYSGCNVSTRIGSIHATLPENQHVSTVLDAWLGDVQIQTKQPTNDYKLNLTTMLGKITKDGESFGKQIKESSSNDQRISSNVVVGDVQIECK